MKSIKSISNMPMINAWLSIPSPWIAEVITNTGYNGITLDMQHGLIDYRTATTMLQVIGDKAVPLVRVSWNDPALIMKMLDAGAMGIICPMVNNQKETERFVGACKYPPLGYRSYGPIRAGFHNKEYFSNANDEVVAIAQIETAESLRNIDEILDVPGLDGVYIGTIDLSISMGLEDTGNLDNPKLKDAVKQIIEKVNDRDKLVCIHTMDPEDIAIVVDMGADLITTMNDNNIIQSQAKFILDQTHDKL